MDEQNRSTVEEENETDYCQEDTELDLFTSFIHNEDYSVDDMESAFGIHSEHVSDQSNDLNNVTNTEKADTCTVRHPEQVSAPSSDHKIVTSNSNVDTATVSPVEYVAVFNVNAKAGCSWYVTAINDGDLPTTGYPIKGHAVYTSQTNTIHVYDANKTDVPYVDVEFDTNDIAAYETVSSDSKESGRKITSNVSINSVSLVNDEALHSQHDLAILKDTKTISSNDDFATSDFAGNASSRNISTTSNKYADATSGFENTAKDGNSSLHVTHSSVTEYFTADSTRILNAGHSHSTTGYSGYDGTVPSLYGLYSQNVSRHHNSTVPTNKAPFCTPAGLNDRDYLLPPSASSTHSTSFDGSLEESARNFFSDSIRSASAGFEGQKDNSGSFLAPDISNNDLTTTGYFNNGHALYNAETTTSSMYDAKKKNVP